MQDAGQDRLLPLEQLMQAHGDRLVRLCFLYLGDYQLAEDAVQDTFLKAARKLQGFRGQAEPLTWLTRIAINTCKDRMRSAWYRRVDGEEALAAIPAPEQEMVEDDTVLKAIYALPPKYKDVILLRYYHEMSLEQVARALRAPVPTISSRLRRGKALLKEQLKGWYFDED